MSYGFFSAPTLARMQDRLVADCARCQLYKRCKSPKMPLWGKGERKILVVGQSPGCITGNSLIETAFRDKSKYPDGIPIRNLVGSKPFFVYSFDVGKQKMVLGKVSRVWCTGRKPVFRVVYEWWFAKGNRKVKRIGSIKVTGNHLFLLKRHINHDPFCGLDREFDYISIDTGLKGGDSLQPFHRYKQEYDQIGTARKSMERESRFLLAHKIRRSLADGEECHHKDEVKKNDTESNLELRTTEDHARHHTVKLNPMDRPGARDNHKRVMQSTTYRNNLSRIHKELLSTDEARRQWSDKHKDCHGQISATLKEKYNDPFFYYQYLLGRTKILPKGLSWVEAKFRSKFPSVVFPPVMDNHRVVSIEYVGVQNTYDMEVEGYHNFAVNGIFVHNSNEDREGRPFSPNGDAGKLLHETLRKFGVDLDRDCWVTNALICRPWKKSEHGNEINRTPLPAEVDYCRPNVVKVIRETKPEVIILLGAEAVKSVIGWIWKGSIGLVSRWDGWRIPDQKTNAWICPTWHPSWIKRSENEAGPPESDQGIDEREHAIRKLLFERHLETACKLQGKPWGNAVPDFGSRVMVSLGESVADTVRALSKGNMPVAFDFECDRLKPDHKDSRIVCCSLSDGKTTIAFPWHGEAVKAAIEFLKSDVPKIGFNMKYELRFARSVLGIWIRNFRWDGMLAAHVLDNRPDICSLEFQSFVLFGCDRHKADIKPYMESKDSNDSNRIREVGLYDLLIMNGLDSLLEWKIAMKQAKKLGVTL